MERDQVPELTDYIGSFISTSKKQTIEQVLTNRTRFYTVVLEDIFQPHNASAVVRTCDCFGIQDLHVIENRNEYTLNPNVTQGASKWVDIHRYHHLKQSSTDRCLDQLESMGYAIYATSSHDADIELDELEPREKAALIFGTELSGLSNKVLQRAGKVVGIPMFGFTESFNLSVSVALCLQPLINKLHRSSVEWRLTDEERRMIRLNWYRRSVRNAKALEKSFYERS